MQLTKSSSAKISVYNPRTGRCTLCYNSNAHSVKECREYVRKYLKEKGITGKFEVTITDLNNPDYIHTSNISVR